MNKEIFRQNLDVLNKIQTPFWHSALPMFTGDVQSEYDEFDHWRGSRRGPALFPGQMSTSLASWEDMP